jgi:hypothetical protein
MSAPATPPGNTRLVRWLLAHHLDYGLGGYVTGNDTTLATGNRVHVAVVVFSDGRCYPFQWEAQVSSYDARLHDPTFIVQAAPATAISKIFGAPDRVYQVGVFKVLVWHKNLLEDVQPASARPGHGNPGRHGLLSGGW